MQIPLDRKPESAVQGLYFGQAHITQFLKIGIGVASLPVLRGRRCRASVPNWLPRQQVRMDQHAITSP